MPIYSTIDCFCYKWFLQIVFNVYSWKEGLLSWSLHRQARWQIGHRACREDHLLVTAYLTGRRSRRRRKCDHFFWAGPRTFLFPSLLYQHTNRENIVQTVATWRLVLEGLRGIFQSIPRGPLLPHQPQEQITVWLERVACRKLLLSSRWDWHLLLGTDGIGDLCSWVRTYDAALPKCQGSRALAGKLDDRKMVLIISREKRHTGPPWSDITLPLKGWWHTPQQQQSRAVSQNHLWQYPTSTSPLFISSITLKISENTKVVTKSTENRIK